MGRLDRLTLVVLLLTLLMFVGCQDLVPRDTSSLFIPRFRRSEIFGFVAGFGTTFAAVPDLAAMLKRRSSAGMNPRMAAIMGVFQVLWVYYRFIDCFSTGDRMERDRGTDQLPERWRVSLFRPNRKNQVGDTFSWTDGPKGAQTK